MKRLLFLFLFFFSASSFSQIASFKITLNGLEKSNFGVTNSYYNFSRCIPDPWYSQMPDIHSEQALTSHFDPIARNIYTCVNSLLSDYIQANPAKVPAPDSISQFVFAPYALNSTSRLSMSTPNVGGHQLSLLFKMSFFAVSGASCSAGDSVTSDTELSSCYNGCTISSSGSLTSGGSTTYNYSLTGDECSVSPPDNTCSANPSYWSCQTCSHGFPPKEGVGCDYNPPKTGDGAGTPSGGVDGADCSGCSSGTNTCSIDGLKYDLGNSLGYHYCDRPPLKTCPDNSVILKTASCNSDSATCNSKASCCSLAISDLACDTSSNHVTCDYKASSNGEYTATASCVAGSAPSNTNSPSYVSVDNSDVIKSITDLQSNQTTMLDFIAKSNRAVTTEQTSALSASIKDNADRVIAGSSSDAASIVSAVNSSASSIKSSIDSLKNSKSTLPTSVKEASKQPAYITTLKNSDFGRMFNNFKNITFPAATCEPITIDLSSTPIGKNVTSNAFCDVSAKAETPLKAVMYIVYLILGFRIIASS